jgi:hypothetical protein
MYGAPSGATSPTAPTPRRGFCFRGNPAEMHSDGPQIGRHRGRMDTDDDLFLDAVDAIVVDALGRIGNDPKARLQFFRRLLAVPQAAPHLSRKRKVRRVA